MAEAFDAIRIHPNHQRRRVSACPLGTAQKVEIQNGNATHIDVAPLGSDNTVSLGASTVTYDPANNVVATSELPSHPKS